MRLTKTEIDRIAPPADGQRFYRDETLIGFGLRVTAGGAKSFVVEKRISGKVRRKTLGRFGVLTAEQARKEAQKFLGQVATGIDPIAKAQEEKASAVTLQQVFRDYLSARKSLKPTTVFDYERLMREAFADWQSKPLASITKDAVVSRHKKLGERSPARANNAMRVLRALFNFASYQYETADGASLFPDNPVSRLSHTRGWYTVKRRRTLITASQLPSWFAAVEELRRQSFESSERTVGDLLLLLLLTGLRRNEALTLEWSDIDLAEKTLTVRDTKNGDPLELPLSDVVVDVLEDRREAITGRYVFGGKSEGSPLVEPRPQMRKVERASGVEFTLHDLRRTFITVAESQDIPVYAIKRLVNHRVSGDVTAGYVVITTERLRAPMQRITEAMMSHARACAQKSEGDD